MSIEHVNGKDVGNVMLYALSTCGWCRKTRQLLSDMGVAYDFIYVDLLTGKEREEAVNAVRKWNPDSSFPTIVINNKKCIIGFKEEDIRQLITQ